MRSKPLFLKIAVPCIFLVLIGAFVAYSAGLFDRSEPSRTEKREQPAVQPVVSDTIPAKTTAVTPPAEEAVQQTAPQPNRPPVAAAQKEDTGLAVAPVSVESDTQRQLFMPSSKSLISPITVDFKPQRKTFMHSTKSMPVKDVFVTTPKKPLDPRHPSQQKKPLKKSTVR